MLRAGSIIRAADIAADPGRKIPFDVAVLAHDERHMRRKVIELAHGERVLVDLPQAVMVGDRDVLVLEDGRRAEIIAAEEHLLEVRGSDALHLAELAWHIGNRHLAAQIEPERILILRDRVIGAMLEGLGAHVRDVAQPFAPLGGAYSGHGHRHGHDHHDHHSHPHRRDDRDDAEGHEGDHDHRRRDHAGHHRHD